MNSIQQKHHRLELRKGRVRAKVSGTSTRPRLSVFRSLQHISAQLVDDIKGTTLAAASSTELKSNVSKTNVAAEVGKLIAERAKAKNIATVVFDRGGNIYHGRVKALAEAARAGGLQF